MKIANTQLHLETLELSCLNQLRIFIREIGFIRKMPRESTTKKIIYVGKGNKDDFPKGTKVCII